MDLFGFDPELNLLPFDGEVNYHGALLSPQQSDASFNQLREHIQWQQDRLIIHGRAITTRRKVAWYGDRPYAYTYSNTTKHALPWTDELLKLKAQVEKITHNRFNSCLLNLYHNGEDAMGWHSDNEEELLKNGAIASLSLGARRKFTFRHKRQRQTLSLELDNGSLLVMKGATQTHWMHCLPKSKKIHQARINLTFRTIRE